MEKKVNEFKSLQVSGAENYEINKHGVIRNKITHQYISPYVCKVTYRMMVNLYNNGVKKQFNYNKLVGDVI